MNPKLIEAIVIGIGPVVDGQIEKATKPLASRLDAVEARALVKGDKGDPGRDADPEIIERLVADAVAKIPPAKDGAPGDKGAPGEVDPALIERMVTEAVAKIPSPKDGEKGEPGRDADPELIARLVAETVAKIPPANDGAPGEKGPPGRDGRDASDLGVIGKMISEQLAKQVNDVFAGLSITSVDDGRTLMFELPVGGETIKRELGTAIVLDRGVWRAEEFKKGDGVTWGGSFWIAQKDTATKPDTPDSDWRLAVKRGQNAAAPAKTVAARVAR